jgi:hypothetical protein
MSDNYIYIKLPRNLSFEKIDFLNSVIIFQKKDLVLNFDIEDNEKPLSFSLICDQCRKPLNYMILPKTKNQIIDIKIALCEECTKNIYELSNQNTSLKQETASLKEEIASLKEKNELDTTRREGLEEKIENIKKVFESRLLTKIEETEELKKLIDRF